MLINILYIDFIMYVCKIIKPRLLTNTVPEPILKNIVYKRRNTAEESAHYKPALYADEIGSYKYIHTYHIHTGSIHV